MRIDIGHNTKSLLHHCMSMFLFFVCFGSIDEVKRTAITAEVSEERGRGLGACDFFINLSLMFASAMLMIIEIV